MSADPYGVTAATFRMEPTGDGEIAGRIGRLTGEYETTYCIGECACGHEL